MDTATMVPGNLFKEKKDKIIQVPIMNTSFTKEGTTENATNDPIPENKGLN